MPSLTNSSVLNGAQCPFLYTVHTFASIQGEGKALRASHLLCASSPWERMSHKHHKSRKRLNQLSEEEEKSGDQQLHTAGRCGAPEGLLPKRGVDKHLCRIGEQLDRL